MKLLSFMLFQLFCLLVLAGCGESKQLAHVPSQGIIVSFGDSLTFGTGVAEDSSYPMVLAELSGRQVIRSGVPGETTDQGLRRLPAVLQEYQPDLVILELGGNDILKRASKLMAKSNLAEMIRMIRQQGAQILLAGVPEFGLIPGTADFYYELEEELDVAAENEVVAKLMKDSSMKSDPIHFNEKGYRKMAEAIHTKLVNLGAL